jgi:hypothetical protein
MPSVEELREVGAERLLRELRRREPVGATALYLPDEELQDAPDEALAAALTEVQKVIYGVDDRQDLFEVTEPLALQDADCVVALCRAADITDNGDGTSTLATQQFGTAYNLCPTERFRAQPTAPFCSGFLVGPDLVATAGHCVDASTVANVRFVFGFRMVDATTPPGRIPNAEIYRGVAVVDRRQTGNGADWAVVRLDRPVLNHHVADTRRAGTIPNGQAVHVIGHPSGLPTKYAPGATVRDNTPTEFFVANLDTYGGNSGSPVFNADTHEVEGILVRGETDFVMSGTCRVSLVCPATGCRGEDCTRTTQFIDDLPATYWDTPAAVAWSPGRLDVFGLGLDRAMYHQAWDGNQWVPAGGNWERLGGTFASPPAAVAWSANRLDVFALGIDRAMRHKAWDGNQWVPAGDNWDRLGGIFTSPPRAVAWSAGRLDVFGLGLDRAVYHKARDGNQWVPGGDNWDRLGGAFTSPPAPVAWGPGRLDVFGVDTDGAMRHKAWDGNQWAPGGADWENLGGIFTSPPAAVAWSANRLDVFGLGTDRGMYHKAWDGNQWVPAGGNWEPRGGTFTSPPAAVAWSAGRLDVFGLNTDRAMLHQAWDGNQWVPAGGNWEPRGGTLL